MKARFKIQYLYTVISIAFILVFSFLLYCNYELFQSLPINSGCSTFLLDKNDTVLVAHNLDDSMEVPGAIFINKRSVTKENISWKDFTSFSGKKSSIPRIQWTSKYGSVTYNTWGKEFPDGGVNENGLYIGEMTLLGTKWPETDKPAFHHHFVMQYLLDNFATVDEVIENLDKISINGHCQWHYFIADRSGRTAAVEFLNETMKIYEGATMPVQVLCNRAYEKELKLIPANDSAYEQMLKNDYYAKDLRLMYASKMISEYNANAGIPLIDYAFSMLKFMGMNNGANKWSVVYDLKNLKMWFRTSKGRDIKYFEFKSFDFSCSSPDKVFDINTDTSGEVAGKFVDYSIALNKQFIDDNFDQINFGFFGNLFFEGRYKKRINKYSNEFECDQTKK